LVDRDPEPPRKKLSSPRKWSKPSRRGYDRVAQLKRKLMRQPKWHRKRLLYIVEVWLGLAELNGQTRPRKAA
jgi:hypothetical protein